MLFLLHWLILAVAVLIAAAAVPGVRLHGFGNALIAAALFAILNWLLGRLIFVILGVATLGLGFLLAFLTRWFVDAIVLKLTAGLTDRISIRGFGPALLMALIMSLVAGAGDYLVRRLY
jgi:putative membrane protein